MANHPPGRAQVNGPRGANWDQGGRIGILPPRFPISIFPKSKVRYPLHDDVVLTLGITPDRLYPCHAAGFRGRCDVLGRSSNRTKPNKFLSLLAPLRAMFQVTLQPLRDEALYHKTGHCFGSVQAYRSCRIRLQGGVRPPAPHLEPARANRSAITLFLWGGGRLAARKPATDYVLVE